MQGYFYRTMPINKHVPSGLEFFIHYTKDVQILGIVQVTINFPIICFILLKLTEE